MLAGAFAAEQPDSIEKSMQPAPDKVNTDDSDSLFDFLDGDENKPTGRSVENTGRDSQSGRRKKMATAGDDNADKPFPVIRKPVCVSQTGPLRPPRPGDPVEPPPGLTDGIRKADAPETHRRPVQRSEADLDDLGMDMGMDLDLDLDDLGLDDNEWPSSDSWVDKSHRPVPVNYQPEGPSLARKAGYVLGFALIACGVVYALIGVPTVQQWTESTIARVTGVIDGLSSDTRKNDTLTLDPTLSSSTDSDNSIASTDTPSAIDPNAPKTLNSMFREQLAQLEVLLQSGSLDAAEQALEDMDRSVYGYGAPEFTEIEQRIAALRQGDVVQPEPIQQSQNAFVEDPLTEQQRIQQEASQIEQEELARAERQAAEAAQAEIAQAEAVQAEIAQAEQAEAAQERAAELAAEQERLEVEAARVETERAEQQRLAQDAERARTRQAELDRAAAEAAQVRADRVAQEQARQEQLALALQERAQLEQSRTSNQAAAESADLPSDWQAVTSGTDDQTIQQLAASQREAARQRRLIEARQREEQTANSQPPSALTDVAISTDTVPAVEGTVVALADPEPEPTGANTGPTPITDADLQQVYGQFAQLQNAIESRDINTVISLTQRSGARIQQVMQMFANNVAITARLRNVSTLDSAGEIQGTLQITRLERADGAVTGPPRNLSSVRLSSVRDGDGWSAISW